MPLDDLQWMIIETLKRRRSARSFVGDSAVFNARFPRWSDDIDIFVEDAPISVVADADLVALTEAGLDASIIATHYGFAIEAVVKRGEESTLLEWSEADRTRFFPIAPHPTFGWALHEADLAVQKLAAAATRRAARDVIDLILIDSEAYDLALLAIALPAKIEGVSPIAGLDRALRTAIGHPEDAYAALRIEGGRFPSPANVKLDFADRVNAAIERILGDCPTAAPGFLYLDPVTGRPALPRADIIASLVRRPASERGLLPTVTPQGGR